MNMKATEIKKEIREEYNSFVALTNEKPCTASVMVEWEDGTRHNDVIAIEDGTDYANKNINDDDILYYVSDIDSLLTMTEKNTMCEFVILDVLGFSAD